MSTTTAIAEPLPETKSRTRTPWWGRALVFFACLAAAVVVTTLLERDYAFIDLGVYDWAAETALESSQLYELTHPGHGLRFTYTPFAALVFVALDQAALLAPPSFTVLSLAALARTCWILAGWRGLLLAGWTRPWAAIGLLGATMLMEPTGDTILLGQVNALLLWLVVEGLLGPLGDRPVGAIGAGLATAIKLTPGIYLAWLAVTGRWRSLLVATVTIAVTIAAAWLVLPRESAAFWGGDGLNSARVGNLEYAPNQSLQGVLHRVFGPGGNDVLWVVLVVATMATCLVLARRYDAVGERATSVGLAAVAALLVSPVSWTHHWLTLLPLVVGLLGIGRRRRIVAALTLAACCIFGSRIVWHVPQGGGLEFDHTIVQLVVSSSYVLCAAGLISAAWLGRPVEATRG